jgi:hypothetical protein
LQQIPLLIRLKSAQLLSPVARSQSGRFLRKAFGSAATSIPEKRGGNGTTLDRLEILAEQNGGISLGKNEDRDEDFRNS